MTETDIAACIEVNLMLSCPLTCLGGTGAGVGTDEIVGAVVSSFSGADVGTVVALFSGADVGTAVALFPSAVLRWDTKRRITRLASHKDPIPQEELCRGLVKAIIVVVGRKRRVSGNTGDDDRPIDRWILLTGANERCRCSTCGEQCYDETLYESLSYWLKVVLGRRSMDFVGTTQ